MHEEFASAACELDKIVEVNLGAMVLKKTYPEKFKCQYLEYLAYLKNYGVKLCIGSDCHTDYSFDFEKAAEMLDTVGIKEQDLWVLPPRQE